MPKSKEPTLDKLLGEGIVTKGDAVSLDYERIPFGIQALDDLIGGGIPKKRISLLIGQPGSGKSYMASQIVKGVQARGEVAAWVDAEWSWDAAWMRRCGVKVADVLVSQPESGEQAFDVIRILMQNKVGVVVLDSVAGLFPAQFNDEDFSHNPMAWQARMVNQAFPRLVPHLAEGSALVLINQTRASIGPVSMPEIPGGKAQTFFSHLTLEIRRGEWISEEDIHVGFNIEIRNRKTKVGGKHYQSCIIPFMVSGGIDYLEIDIRDFIAKDLIKQRGAWFSVEGVEKKLAGQNGVKKYFIEHPEEVERLKNVA